MNRTIRKLFKKKQSLLLIALTFLLVTSILGLLIIQESVGLDPLVADLVGYWRLNESSGTNTEDLSGNGYNGTLVNMEDEDWVAGKLNNALSFDGVNEYVNLLDIADFERTQPFSVEAWIKTSQKGIIVSRQQWAIPYRGWYVGTNPTGRLQFILTNTWGSNQVAAYQDDVNMIDDAWHHLIITYAGSSNLVGVKFYVDGQLRTTKGVAGGLSATIRNGENCQINGASDLNENFAGIIDEVAIYDKELSSSEVAERWNNGDGAELDFSIETPNTASITVSSDVYFLFAPYGTEINFSSTQALNSFELDSTTWFWSFDSYRFQVQNANMTITTFFINDGLGFTLYRESGNTSTTKIYTASRGEPASVKVDGVEVPTDYDEVTGILTISVVHSSPEEVEIDWTPDTAAEATNVVIARGYIAVVIGSLGCIVLVAAAILGIVQGRSTIEDAIPLVIMASGITIALFIAIVILNAFSGI